MNWSVVRLADVVPSAWRNGGGTTRELVAWPEAGAWEWRASVAEVECSGPFSRFDHVQRWFAVLSGAGVRLTLDGRAQDLGRGSAPFAFDGATPVDCELRDGATQDFNLMVRGARPAHMQRLSADQRFVLRRDSAVLLYANDAASLELDGQTTVLPADSLAWTRLTAGRAVQVRACDALWMEIAL